MDEHANTHLIRQCYDSFFKGDIERLLSFMAPDIEWDIPQMEGVPFSGKRHGIEQVREFFKTMDDCQKPLEFHPGEFLVQGDRVVVFGHFEWAVNATGTEFASDFVHSFKIRHGQVAALHEFMDTHACVKAYGSGAGAGMARDEQPGRPSMH
ncbi:MAG TPA: nuclear transport factor 2 family protein [Telluria sp.]|nr:nuclear transport factor 2 family protein [Telluria sp.]